MNYFVIGIGGTGAKCVESLIHLCAAGMMPEGELYVLFVDTDTANGNLERSQVTLNSYKAFHSIQLGQIDLFKTPITNSSHGVWSPVTVDGINGRTLSDIFRYNILRATDQSGLADLFDVLYSREEIETPLDKGFRGHPSIGAAIMANAMELGDEEPWKTFRIKIQNDLGAGHETKIFIFGSVFGGTGAAFFSTVAHLVRNELNQFTKIRSGQAKIGGALILPYFSFVPSGEDKELRVSSEDFLLNTQTALKYYYEKQKTVRDYDAIYLIGDETMNPTKNFSIGARMQQNDPHFIEIYAALAAINFFANEVEEYQIIARRQEGKIQWEDLPDGHGGNNIKQKIRQLTRFAAAYLNVYYPMLESILVTKKGNRTPWYVDFFERTGMKLGDHLVQNSLYQVKNYCEKYFIWQRLIHEFAPYPEIELINWRRIEDGQSQFDNLIFPIGSPKTRDLDKVWEKVCNTKILDSTATPFGKFIQALYMACA